MHVLYVSTDSVWTLILILTCYQELHDKPAHVGYEVLLSEGLWALLTQIPEHHLNTHHISKYSFYLYEWRRSDKCLESFSFVFRIICFYLSLIFCYAICNNDLLHFWSHCTEKNNHLVTFYKRLQNRSEEDDGFPSFLSHMHLFIRADNHTSQLE